MSTTDDTAPAGEAPPPPPGTHDPQPPPPAPPPDPDGQAEQDDELAKRTIVDPNDAGFYYARVMMWILLHPEIPHTACRVYGVMRSLYTHKHDQRSISKDELRWLVPGVNGKPMSRTALNDALQVLERFELVVNPDGRSRSWRLRDPQTGVLQKQTELTFQLGLLPPEGDAYRGFRNVFEKLNAYPGPGWDGKPVDNSAKAQDNTSTGNPVEGEPADTPPAGSDTEPAGGDLDRKSGAGSNTRSDLDRNSEDTDRNSGHLDRNSGRNEPLTSGNRGRKNYIQEPLDEEHAAAGPSLRSGPLPTELSGQVANGVTKQDELILNTHHAHARRLAGEAACKAIAENPGITEHELMAIIGDTWPNLEATQVQLRAIQLHAFEKTARQRRDEPGPQRTNGKHRAGSRRPATMPARRATRAAGAS